MTSASMVGKICLVTGANSGIGKMTAQGLAKQGATVVMVCRNRERGESAQQEIAARSGNANVDLLIADLASQRSVRAFVDVYKEKYSRLDVLINNAGAIFARRQESEDGLEYTFALNHMGYFLPTVLLLDHMIASAPARIINVSSDAHRAGRIDFADLQNEHTYRAFMVYAQTKLENILFTKELARRLEGTGVTANALHPGLVQSNFGGSAGNSMALRFFFKVLPKIIGISPEKAAEWVLYLATSPEVAGVTGKYMAKGKFVEPSPQASDSEAAGRLWAESERLAGLTTRV